MKKFFLILLINTVFIVSLPLSNAFAYSGGLLDGKPIQFGDNVAFTGTSAGTTNLMTDGNETTSYTVPIYNQPNDYSGFIFDKPMYITGLKIHAPIQSGGLYVYFYDPSGVLIKNYMIDPRADGTLVNVDFNNVSRIAFRAKQTTYPYIINEFDVFGSADVKTSLLKGLVWNRGADITNINGSNLYPSDGDTNYLFTLAKGGSVSDMYWTQLPTIKNVDAYRLMVNPLMPALRFYDINKNLIESVVSPKIDYFLDSFPVIENVAFVAIENTSTTTILNLAEFELYESKQTVIGLTETHSYDSLTLSWVNPEADSFSGVIINENGMEVANLEKTISTYSISGLAASTTYNFDVIAKYSDGSTSTIKSIEVLTDAAPIISASTTNVNVNPGSLMINSFPAILEFEEYMIDTSNATLNLKNPFKISVEDFTGSYAGWSLTMTVGNLTSGSDVLKNPTLNSNFSDVSINDADDTGIESLVDVSNPGTFAKTDGVIPFDSAKKILSAQATNSEAVGRHYFNFPTDSIELSFENSSKAGLYTGITTFALVASP
jgi:hypothetical protein